MEFGLVALAAFCGGQDYKVKDWYHFVFHNPYSQVYNLNLPMKKGYDLPFFFFFFTIFVFNWFPADAVCDAIHCQRKHGVFFFSWMRSPICFDSADLVAIILY